MTQWTLPMNVLGLQSFLGFANHYCRFVEGQSKDTYQWNTFVTDQTSQLTHIVGIGIRIGIVIIIRIGIDFGNTIKSIYIADIFLFIAHSSHVFLSSFSRRIIICYNPTNYATTIQQHHHATFSSCILVRYFRVRHKQLVNQVLPLNLFGSTADHYWLLVLNDYIYGHHWHLCYNLTKKEQQLQGTDKKESSFTESEWFVIECQYWRTLARLKAYCCRQTPC